jgi:hypothetical protein
LVLKSGRSAKDSEIEKCEDTDSERIKNLEQPVISLLQIVRVLVKDDTGGLKDDVEVVRSSRGESDRSEEQACRFWDFSIRLPPFFTDFNRTFQPLNSELTSCLCHCGLFTWFNNDCDELRSLVLD